MEDINVCDFCDEPFIAGHTRQVKCYDCINQDEREAMHEDQDNPARNFQGDPDLNDTHPEEMRLRREMVKDIDWKKAFHMLEYLAIQAGLSEQVEDIVKDCTYERPAPVNRMEVAGG